MQNLSKYHPYWSAELAQQYDKRAGEIRALTRSRSIKSPVVNRADVLAKEYGSMDRSEFDCRIKLAQTASALRRRWHDSVRLLVDASVAPQSSEGYEADNINQPVYVHLGGQVEIKMGTRALLDGLYVERLSRDGEPEVFGLGAVGIPIYPTESRATLGDLLRDQSMMSYGFADSLGPHANFDVVIQDPTFDSAIFRIALERAQNLFVSRPDTPAHPPRNCLGSIR